MDTTPSQGNVENSTSSNLAEKRPIRILTIGDPHFKESNPGQTQAMTRKIVEIARQKSPDLIICLGDVLDRHAKLHTDPLCEAIIFFRQLSQIAHLCIIIGNHDRRTNTDYLTDRHPFTAVKYWEGVTVVDQTKTIHLHGHLITLVPYVWPGRFIEAMDDFFLEEDSESSLASIFGSEFAAKTKDESERYSLVAKIAHKLLSSPNLVRLLMNKSELISKAKDKSERYSLLTRIVVKSLFYPTDLLSLLALRSKFFSEAMDEMQRDLLETKILPAILSHIVPPLASEENRGSMNDPAETGEVGTTDPAETEEIGANYSGRWWWKSSIIFAHQEFKGAKMGAIVSEIGDTWPIDGPLVISGHIHDHHRVQENVWYTGTPIQHAFGDTADKTISYLSWSSDGGWQEERIDLELIKRKTVQMRITDMIRWTPPSGFLVKAVISGTPGELRTLSVLSKITDLRKNGIVVTIKTLPDKPLTISDSQGIKHDSVSYLIALWKEVCGNERMKLWYRNIFGGTVNLNQWPTLNSQNQKFPIDKIEIGKILEYLLSEELPAISDHPPRLDDIKPSNGKVKLCLIDSNSLSTNSTQEKTRDRRIIPPTSSPIIPTIAPRTLSPSTVRSLRINPFRSNNRLVISFNNKP